MIKVLSVRAPMRVDLAGAWTDVPPFASRERGAVLNLSIDSYVFGKREEYDKLLNNYVSGPSGKHRMSSNGINISYWTDLPTGTGLGSSGALNVVLAKLVNPKLGKVELAEKAIELARVWGVQGGKQDEYAAAMGGGNLLFFREDETETVPVDISWLDRHLVVCYTQSTREGGKIHERVWAGIEDGRLMDLMRELAQVPEVMLERIQARDLNGIGTLMQANWEIQKRLDEHVTNDVIENLFKIACDNGACGGKACGAGGGGCIVFLTEDRLRLMDALHGHAPVIDCKADSDGVIEIKD